MSTKKFSQVILEILQKEGKQWILRSHKNPKKILGRFKTEEDGMKRERQINWFKNKGK